MRACANQTLRPSPPFPCTEQEGLSLFAAAAETFPRRERDGLFSSRHFPGGRRMQTHLRTGGRYRCSRCPYSSDKKDNMSRHERSHTGERPFVCTTCGMAFTDQGHLTRHRTVHTGERPYECAECGASFTQKGDVVRHARTHLGDRAYSCHLCGYRASESGNVKKHVIAVHSKEYPYMCERCGKGFVAPSMLRAHLAVRHFYKDEEC
ncbi:zinc finger protein 530 [Ixodes scapularis]